LAASTLASSSRLKTTTDDQIPNLSSMADSSAAASFAVSSFRRAEQHVAALDVGTHPSVPERGHDLAQVRHRDLVPAADVDAA
jgi:hypothetical protein